MAEPLPKTMKAIRVDEPGPPENLKLVQVEVPSVGDDDVLIKVDYAGLIYGDTQLRRDAYFYKMPRPWFPGKEVAGHVVAIGRNVRSVAIGDRVMDMLLGEGGCAEYALTSTRPRTSSSGAVIPPGELMKIPDNVASEDALVYLVNFRLAHFVFSSWSKLAPGSTVLIHGASGGMGSMVLQLAVKHGCRVIALHRTAEEADFCRALGAAHCINTTVQPYVEAVLEYTGNQGVAASFNGVGGETLLSDWRVVEALGDIHAYGYVAGKPPVQLFDINKTVALKTFYASDFFREPYLRQATQAMYSWFASEPLVKPGLVIPLDQAPRAHRLLEQGAIIGKIVLKV